MKKILLIFIFLVIVASSAGRTPRKKNARRLVSTEHVIAKSDGATLMMKCINTIFPMLELTAHRLSITECSGLRYGKCVILYDGEPTAYIGSFEIERNGCVATITLNPALVEELTKSVVVTVAFQTDCDYEWFDIDPAKWRTTFKKCYNQVK